MSAAWRLVVDGPRPGAENMALDRATLACRAAGAVPPTLRLYTWTRPTVTIGRFQEVGTVDVAACSRRGFDLARRPTGGRGVLHDDEVTYSIVAGTADGVPRGTRASYARLCEGLAEAYRILGVPARLTARPRGTQGSAACYMHATPADLSLGAAKLSGSAQVWSGDAVLQHGSFVISRDVDAEAEVFRLEPDEARTLASGTATLTSALGRSVSSDEVVEAVLAGVSAALEVDLVPGRLTDDEVDMAAGLLPEHVIPLAGEAVPEPSR